MNNYIEILDEKISLPTSGASLSLQNAFFDTENADRGYSLPFNVALSPTMASKFKPLTRLDSVPNYGDLTAKLFLNRQEFETGIFKINKISNNVVDGNFQSEVSQLLANAAEVKIADLMPTFPLDAPSGHWEYFLSLPTPGRGYSLTLNGTTISVTATTSSPFEIPSLVTALNAGVAAVNPNFESTFTDRLVILDPHDQNPQIRSTSPFLTESMSKTYGQSQQEIFLAYISALTTTNAVFRMPRKRNAKIYEKPILAGEYPINPMVWDSGTSTWLAYGSPHSESENWGYTYQPFLTLRYLLFLIRVKFQYDAIEGDFAEWTDVEKLLIDNDTLFDDVKKEFVWDTTTSAFVEKYINRYVNKIEFKKHVPDMTAKDVLTGLCDWLHLTITVKNGRIIFKKKRAQLTKIPHNWTGLQGSDISRNLKKSEGFTLKYKAYDGDALPPLPNYVGGDGKVLIELPLSIPNKMDYAGEMMIQSERPSTSTAGGLRLFFDRGLRGTHWASSNDHLAEDGTTIIGLFSLRFEGDYGIYNVFRKGVDERINDGWVVTRSVLLSTADIFALKESENTRVYIFDAKNGALDGVLKTVDVRLLPDGLGLAKIDVVCV